MIIRTLIRKKRLVLGQAHQALASLSRQQQRQAQLIDLQGSRLQREREHLHRELRESSELSVYKLIYTHAHIGKIEQELRAIQNAKEGLDKEIAQLTEHTKKSNKEIEKLESIDQERQQEDRAEQLKHEWAALDQWVINRRGNAS